MHLRRSLTLVVAALVGCAAVAQQVITPAPTVTTAVPAFEVATIKPSGRTDGSLRLEPTPDGFTGMNISLLNLVGEAYGIFDAQLITGGPPWIDRDKFDLEAKFNAAEIPDAKNLTYRQRGEMLQSLLADRFHLKVHWEKRTFPVYDLVIAKGGPKLRETKPEDVFQGVGGASCLFRGSRRGYIQVQGCRPKDLEDHLRSATGRTVIDKTGITTRSDFELRWTPDNTPADAPESTGQSIFTALQEQLGLKLVPATAPLNILVIDSASRPSEN
ncbi:TIGR03435 family protein [Granulicella sp. S156]|uniref:TIGR03435 family protein n=1 Tax=Granulicella sp. S156 TaxID=1747224 RepID=UPI00131CC2DE|nr:TIGR03435 family protein [Granulicella sp. S156]